MRDTHSKLCEYRGVVTRGVVVLDGPVSLPEGAEVRVRPVKKIRNVVKRKRRMPTLYEQLKPFIGKAKGLPADMAEKHDHYLYGVPKRK